MSTFDGKVVAPRTSASVGIGNSSAEVTNLLTQTPEASLRREGIRAGGRFSKPQAFTWMDVPDSMSLADINPTDTMGPMGPLHADVREAVGGTFQGTYGIEGVGEGVQPGIAPPARPMSLEQEAVRRGRRPEGEVPSAVSFRVSPLEDRDVMHPSNRDAMNRIWKQVVEEMPAEDIQWLRESKQTLPEESYKSMVQDYVRKVATDQFGYSDAERAVQPSRDEVRIEEAKRHRELLTTGIMPEIRIAMQRQDQAGQWGLQLKSFFANPDNIKSVPESQRQAFAYLHQKLIDADYGNGWGWAVDAVKDAAGAVKTGAEQMIIGSGSFTARTTAHGLSLVSDFTDGAASMLTGEEAVRGLTTPEQTANLLYQFANDADEVLNKIGERGVDARTLYNPNDYGATIGGLTNWLKAIGQGVGSLVGFGVGGAAVNRIAGVSRISQGTKGIKGWLARSGPMVAFAASSEAGIFFAHEYRALRMDGVEHEQAASVAYQHAMGYGLAAGLLEKFGFDTIKKAMYPLLPERSIKKELARGLIAGSWRFIKKTGEPATVEALTEYFQYQAEILSQSIAKYRTGTMSPEEEGIFKRQIAALTSQEAVVSLVVGGIIGGGAATPAGIANAVAPYVPERAAAMEAIARQRPGYDPGGVEFNNLDDLQDEAKIEALVRDPHLGKFIEVFIKAPWDTATRRMYLNFVRGDARKANEAERQAFRERIAAVWSRVNGYDEADAAEETAEAPEAETTEAPEAEAAEAPEAEAAEAPEAAPEPVAEPEAPTAPEPTEEPVAEPEEDVAPEPKPEPEVDELFGTPAPSSEVARSLTDEQLDRLNQNPRGLESSEIAAIQEEIANRKKPAPEPVEEMAEPPVEETAAPEPVSEDPADVEPAVETAIVPSDAVRAALDEYGPYLQSMAAEVPMTEEQLRDALSKPELFNPDELGDIAFTLVDQLNRDKDFEDITTVQDIASEYGLERGEELGELVKAEKAEPEPEPEPEPEVEPFTADNLPDRIDELDEAVQEDALAAFTIGGEKLDAFLNGLNARQQSEEIVEESSAAEKEEYVEEEAELDDLVVSEFRILKVRSAIGDVLTSDQLAEVLGTYGKKPTSMPTDIFLEVQEPSRRSRMRLQLTAFADTSGGPYEYQMRPYALLQTAEGIAALPLTITETDLKNPPDALNNIFAGLMSRILNRDTEADMAQVGTVVSPEEMWRLDGVFERSLQLFHTRIVNRSEGNKKEYPRLTIDDIYKDAVDGGKRGKTPDGADRTLQNQKLVEIVLERAMNEMVRARVAKRVAEGVDKTDKGFPSAFGPIAVLKAAREVEDAFTNVATKKTRMLGQQFSTPPQIAAFAQLLGLQGASKFGDATSSIVEPQYGTGSLVSLLGGSQDIEGMEIDPARVMASQVFRGPTNATSYVRTTNTLEGEIGGTMVGNANVIANPPFGKPPKNADAFVKMPVGVNKDHLPKSVRSPVTFETNNVEDVVMGKALTELPDLGIGVFIIGAPGGPTLTDEARQKAYQRGIFKALYSHNVLGHYTMAGKLYKATGTTFPVDVIVVQKTDKKKRLIRSKGKVAPDLMNGELPQILDSADSIDKAMRDYSENYGAKKIDLQRRLERLVGGAFSSVPGRKSVRAERVSRGTGLNLGSGTTTEPSGTGTAERGAAEEQVSPGGQPTDGNSTYVNPDTGASTGESQQERTGEVAESQREEGDAGERATGPVQEPDGAGRSALDDDMLNDLLDGAKKRRKKGSNRRGVAIIPSEEEIQKAVKFITAAIRNGITSFRNFVKALIDKLTYDKVVGAIDEELAEAFNRAWAKASQLFKKKGIKPAEMDFNSAVQLEDPNRVTEAQRIDPEFVDPNEIQVVYTPVSMMSAPEEISGKLKSAETLAPRNQRDANIRALQKIERKTKKPLSVYVADNLGMSLTQVASVFHAEQVDAIAAAIYANERGQGFTIGDQTGVGKGRFVAAMLLYGHRKGFLPIFMTQKDRLYRDMLRDLVGITQGMKDLPLELLPTNTTTRNIGRPVDETTGKPDPRLRSEFPVPGSKKTTSTKQHLEDLNGVVARYEKTGVLTTGEDVPILAIASTYSQLAGPNGKGRQALFERMVKTGKAFIVMDEAHEAAGTDVAREQRAKKRESVKKKIQAGANVKMPSPHLSEFMLGLTENPNTAGVVFSSATFAKRPEAMSLFLRAGLANTGKKQRQKIMRTIRNGGVSMMASFSQMLAEGGYYMRRQKSFEGISFETTEVQIDPSRMDVFANMLSEMFDFANNKAVLDMFEDKAEQIKDTFASRGYKPEAMNVNSGSDLYTNVMYLLAGKFLASTKAMASAQTIIDAIQKNNELVLLGTDQTNEASLERFMEDNEIGVGQTFQFSMADIARQTMESLRYASFENPQTGEKETVYLTDSELEANGVKEMFDGLLKMLENPELEVLRELPGMPVDYVMAKAREAGIQTGEVTGRNYRIEMDTKDPTMIRVFKRSAAEKNNNKATDDFNNARTQLTVINSSGATGGSFHPRKGVSERVRHLFIIQALADVNAFIQLLGRINRYGQTKLPKYTLIGANTPFDTKIMAVMAKKLKSLNASSTAESKSAIDFKVRDIAHLIGDIAVYEWQEANQEMSEKLKLKRFTEPSLRRAANAGDNVKKLLNRIVMLSSAEQNQILTDIEARVDDIMETFNRQGINPMAAPVRDYQFRVVSEMEVLPAAGEDVFDGPVYLSQIEGNVLTKPPRPEEIFELLDKNYGDLSERLGVDRKPVQLNRGGFGNESRAALKRLTEYVLQLQHLHDENKKLANKTAAQIKEIRDDLKDNPEKQPPAVLASLEATQKQADQQVTRLDKLRLFADAWRYELEDVGGGFINRSFDLSRGKDDQIAGVGIITKFVVQTTDPNDQMFYSLRNIQIELVGDEVGIGMMSGSMLRARSELVANEVDLYVRGFHDHRGTEFEEAATADLTGRRQLMYAIRGQLTRAMSEIENDNVRSGQLVFATTIEGNTERIILTPDALPADFDAGNISFSPQHAFSLMEKGTYSDFRITTQAKGMGQAKLGRTSQTEEEYLLEIDTSVRIDPLLEFAAQEKLTMDSPSAARTVLRVPKAKGNLFVQALDVTTEWFDAVINAGDTDAFNKATGRVNQMEATEGAIVSEELQGFFAKKIARLRKRRQNRNRRGFAYIPSPRVPKNMKIRKADPSGRFAHFIQPGLFMEKISFRGNKLYARSLQRLRDAYDNYTKEIDVNLKRDSKRWQQMPKDWRRDKNNRFMFIMDHALEPWIVDQPKMSELAMRALGWGDDQKKAYKMLMEAPDSVKDVFKYFRARDEYMRKEMVRAIQRQKIAVFSQFSMKEMVEAAEEQGRDWEIKTTEIYDDDGKLVSKTKDIYDEFGKMLSPGMAAKQLALMAVPTAGFGYRYAHVFHTWTGNFMVNKVTDDGSLEPIEGDYNLEASFKTEAQAVRAGRDWLKLHPKDKIEITPVISYPGDVQRLTDAQVNDIKRHIKEYTKASSAEVSAALRGKIGKLKYRSKFYAPFMKREGKGGYTKNYIEVWQSSVVGFERWRELTAANRTVQEDIEAMRGKTPGAARELQGTLDFLWNGRQAMVGVSELMNKTLDKTLSVMTGGRVAPRVADRAMDFARAANYFVNLAWPGNIAGAAVNATQIPAVTASMIGYLPTTRAAAQAAAQPRRSLQILEQYGRFTGRGKWDDGSLPIVSGARRAMSAVNDLAPFTGVEKINQNMAFLIGFYHYMNLGYSEQAAAAAANRLRLFTQMTYNAAEVPKIYRSKLGMTLFQYKRFSLSWLALAATSARDAVSGQGPLLPPVRLLLGGLVFGGLNAFIPRTVQGALVRYAGYKTFSGMMTGGIGTLAAMLGYGGDDDDETVERLSNMLTYGITSGIANGEFGLSARFSPYPIRAPYQYDGAFDAFGQMAADVVLGPTGSTILKSYDAALKDRSTLPLPERLANMTTMTRQLYQLNNMVKGDMARRSGMGNRNYTQSNLSQISRFLGFEDTEWMKQSSFIQSMNAATEMNAEMVNDVAKAMLQGVEAVNNQQWDEANARFKEGLELLVRYNNEPGFEITPDMIRRRIDNMKESRGIGLLIRSVKDANNTVARNWFLSMPPSERQTLIRSLTREAVGVGQ